MKRRNHILVVTMILAVLATAEKCDKDDVRDQVRTWNQKAGKALVKVNAEWTEFYRAETDRIGDELIAEHADDPDWTEEQALEDFEQATAKLNEHDDRFQRAKMATKAALNANEQILDAWEHGEQKAVFATIADATHALYDLLEVFLATGLDVPNILQTVIAGAENLMELLHDPDPNDPADD